MHPQKILFSKDGNLVLGLIFLSFNIYFIYIESKKIKDEIDNKRKNTILPSQLSWSFIFVAALSGIIGAKLFAVLENLPLFIKDPIGQLLSFSGLTFYGGLIAGTISVVLYAKRYKINIYKLADVFAPALILAYGIGRLGCHFSGDGDWGIPSTLAKKPSILPDWFWSYSFPNNVIKEGDLIPGCLDQTAENYDPYGYCYELSSAVYPTSLYEACFGILAFIFLWNIRKHISTSGILFCIYLILNGVERFLIEWIRVTDKILGPFTQAQIIGVIICIIGIVGIYYLNNRKNLQKDEITSE